MSHEARAVVHVLQGHARRVQLQLQSRPVRQARARAIVRRRSASSSECGGCTSSGSGCATRTATTPSRKRCSPPAFLVLGLFGGWVHFQRDRRSFWYFGSLMFTMTLLLIYYLNFKLGASQDPVDRRRRTRCATATTSSSGASRRGACGRRSDSCSCGSRSRRCSVRRRSRSGARR